MSATAEATDSSLSKRPDAEADKGSTGGPSESDLKKCLGCGKTTVGQLSCPTCLKLGISTSIFCSQACFKANWAVHKTLHKAVAKYIGQTTGGPVQGYESLALGYKENDMSTWLHDTDLRLFKTYTFSGSLRPWPRTAMRSVPPHISKPDYYLTGDPDSEVATRHSQKIVARTPEEIERIRKASRIARMALDLAHSMVKPGVTTDAIDVAVHDFIISMGGFPSTLNYCGFPKSCCTSINEVICHGIPDLRPLQDGDIVNVDITVYHEGMHGDLNETFLCGNVDQEGKDLVRGAYECMMHAIAACRPGFLYRDLGNIISDTAEKRGLSVVRSYCGHGIGTLFHTAPNVPHYRRNKAVGIMKVGHVFTVEPMINLGTWRDATWPDDWTSTTTDGRRSAQFEHTMVVTQNGVELLTARLPTSPPLEIDVPSEEYYLSGKHRDD